MINCVLHSTGAHYKRCAFIFYGRGYSSKKKERVFTRKEDLDMTSRKTNLFIVNRETANKNLKDFLKVLNIQFCKQEIQGFKEII